MLFFVLMSLIFQFSEALQGIVVHFVTLAIDRILSSGGENAKSQFIATVEHFFIIFSISATSAGFNCCIWVKIWTSVNFVDFFF